jgi:hypothetical protein
MYGKRTQAKLALTAAIIKLGLESAFNQPFPPTQSCPDQSYRDQKRS